ncbi:DUF7674 family protein [Streptomyces hiroshimensis]|uniref:Uncharacterized protein n=1 Tax=Streptomyces hiroshimensis TaxID=66424 RepID=A0ABQ2YJL4_9ACTN|nr:hypothetical protein [Streptomyces hiroshimensis]GGX86535.1 hypothetical protein GCM10010324_35090 [Streptomyces hiroshimensis]
MSTPAWWDELMSVSDALAAADRAEVAYWRGGAEDGREDSHEDDVPPVTLRLAALGREFASHAHELTAEQQHRFLGVLEDVLRTGSEADGTAVATGFFESLLNAWNGGFDLQAAWAGVGAESQACCLDLNQFWGIESPEWMLPRVA